jgi:hypothetical protein
LTPAGDATAASKKSGYLLAVKHTSADSFRLTTTPNLIERAITEVPKTRGDAV